jgi:hypothetical protein
MSRRRHGRSPRGGDCGDGRRTINAVLWCVFGLFTLSSSFATAFEPLNNNSSTVAQLGFASSKTLQSLDDVRYVWDVPDDRRSASSVYANDARGTHHYRGRLDSVQAWSSAHNSHGQWFQMDASSERDIAGVVIRGRHNYDQFVRAFKVQYAGNNGHPWYDVDGGFEFSGNYNWHDAVSVPFSSSVRARYIRIFPRDWHNHMSMRCALLLSTNVLDVPDSRFSASSVYANDARGTHHYRGRLNSVQAWSSAHNSHGQWLQMDASSERDIAGVVIRGRHNYDQFVRAFKVQYAGNNGHPWYDVDGGFEFSGNYNWHDAVSVPFSSSVRARYIRIFPSRTGTIHMSMRCALLLSTNVLDVPDSRFSASSVYANDARGTHHYRAPSGLCSGVVVCAQPSRAVVPNGRGLGARHCRSRHSGQAQLQPVREVIQGAIRREQRSIPLGRTVAMSFLARTTGTTRYRCLFRLPCERATFAFSSDVVRPHVHAMRSAAVYKGAWTCLMTGVLHPLCGATTHVARDHYRAPSGLCSGVVVCAQPSRAVVPNGRGLGARHRRSRHSREDTD